MCEEPTKRMSMCKSGEGSVKLTGVKLPDTSVARAGKRFEFDRVWGGMLEELFLYGLHECWWERGRDWVFDMAWEFGGHKDLFRRWTRFIRTCGCSYTRYVLFDLNFYKINSIIHNLFLNFSNIWLTIMVIMLWLTRILICFT